jgi:NTP pyrophosphatase (non-canonical NTP hydrolase)
MNPSEYVKNALRTESGNYEFQGVHGVTPRIEHAVIGLVTEAGELTDAVKRSKIFGRELDKVNVIEEAGDIMWYLALLSDELGVPFEDIWEKNVNKLRKRYPEKFTTDKALNRDLDGERKILES